MTHLDDNYMDVYSFQSKKEGNSHCGDAHFYQSSDTHFFAVVADGLGSGFYAHQSAQAVIEAAKENQHQDIELIMKACNEAVSNKRGAAVFIVKIDYVNQEFTYCGVGNIKFFLMKQDGSTFYPIPVNGYLSGKRQSFIIRRFQYEVPSRFFIHTDGLHQMARKKYLNMNMPLDYIYQDMMDCVSHKDDTTFMIASLK